MITRIPPPTIRRRSDGVEAPVNVKPLKLKELPYAKKTTNTDANENARKGKAPQAQVLLPIKVKGVCPYCEGYIGRGLFGHMRVCQTAARSPTK